MTTPKLKMSQGEFLNLPTDVIPEKDVYTVNDKSTITEVRDILSGIGSEVFDAARNTPALASRMGSVVADVRSGRLTSAEGLQRAMGVLGGRGGVLDKLSAPVKNKLSQYLGPEATDAAEMLIRGQGGGGYSRRGYGSVSRTRDFIDIFEAFSGNEQLLEIFDVRAEVGLIGAILSEAIALGIPEAIDQLLARAPDDWSRVRIVNQNLSYMVLSGDIATVNKAIDILGGPAILAMYPQFCRDFLGRFSLGMGQKRENYPALKASIIAMFVRINPMWDQALRNGRYIPSLLPFTTMSSDARAVFMSTKLHVPQVLLGDATGELEVLSWLKEKYPHFPQ